jgi:predicted nuclease of restriction endonuclease-like (RecB) superfamily
VTLFSSKNYLEGWGSKVIDRLSLDLMREFPEMKGLSSRNLKYMRAFAEAYPEEQIVQQAAAQIPWFHNCAILDKVKNPVTRDFYIRSTISQWLEQKCSCPPNREWPF